MTCMQGFTRPSSLACSGLGLARETNEGSQCVPSICVMYIQLTQCLQSSDR